MPGNINIVLADDDRDDCLLFKEALGELPLSSTFTSVNSCEQLLQLLRKPAAKLPDILFLDMNMPRKNGFECLEEIKGDTVLSHFPVIILSTSLDVRLADKLYRSGAHYYISKPADFAQLKGVVSHVISLTVQKNIQQPPREQFLIADLNSTLF